MEITQKFVERYFGDDFQCLYATHDNTEHVHSHILFNSVSWRTGRKYRYEKGDWAKEIQPIVNELCKEYGLSIQDIEVGTEEKSLKKWDKTKQGIFKWNHQVSLDVEDSISFANSYENFLKLMELKGYEIEQGNGEAFLKPMGEKKFLRLTDISAYYTKEAIGNQIEKGIQRETSRSRNSTPRIARCRRNYRKYIPQTSYQKAFFAKMYRTGQLKRKPYSQMWRYKEEAARFEKLQSQYLYLCSHNICSTEELENWKKNLTIRMDDLDEVRHQIYKRRYPYKSVLALLKIIEENKAYSVSGMGQEQKQPWMETGYLKMKDIEAIPLEQRLNILNHYQSGEYDPITITSKLIIEQKEDHAVVRLPRQSGKFIRIPIEDFYFPEGSRTALAFLKKKEEMKVYTELGDEMLTMKGNDIFHNYFDTVNANIRTAVEHKSDEREMEKGSRETGGSAGNLRSGICRGYRHVRDHREVCRFSGAFLRNDPCIDQENRIFRGRKD